MESVEQKQQPTPVVAIDVSARASADAAALPLADRVRLANYTTTLLRLMDVHVRWPVNYFNRAAASVAPGATGPAGSSSSTASVLVGLSETQQQQQQPRVQPTGATKVNFDFYKYAKSMARLAQCYFIHPTSEFTKMRRELRSRAGTDHAFWKWTCETVASYSVRFDVVLKRLMCCHELLRDLMLEAHKELRPLLARMTMANGGVAHPNLPSGSVDLKRTGTDSAVAMLSEIALQQQSATTADTDDDDDDDAPEVVECVSLLREMPLADHHLAAPADVSPSTFPCGHTPCVFTQAPMVIRTAACNTTYYEPCKVVGSRRVGRGLQYRVHMRGFASPAGDEWILARTIRDHYPTLLKEFEAEQQEPNAADDSERRVTRLHEQQQQQRRRESKSGGAQHLVHAGVAILQLSEHPRTKRRRGVRIVMSSPQPASAADADADDRMDFGD